MEIGKQVVMGEILVLILIQLKENEMRKGGDEHRR